MSSPNGNGQLGVNLSFTKFLFIVPRRDDDAARARLRAAGAIIGRGFFNDFDAEGARDAPPQETTQFLTREGPVDGVGLAAARYAVQVCSKYRPRLQDTGQELRRRLADHAEITALDGAVRVLQYTSAQMYAYAYKDALPRLSGRFARNAVVIPIRKTREWWEKPSLERHAYFYPHSDGDTGARVKGHARAAEAGIASIYRQVYHNPDGYGRDDEFDFISYFEFADEHLPTFDQICRALRDERQNPEWRYVIEGPEWRGKRVLRW
jgi:hypothetical protein